MLVVFAVLACGVGAVLLLYDQLRTIDVRFRELSAFALPLGAAAYEMEINVVEAGLGVMKYLDQPHTRYRRRVEKDNADFARFKARYDALATDEAQKRLGREADPPHRDFIALGEALMARQDELEARLDRLADTTGQIDGLLGRAFERGDQRAAKVQFRIAEMGRWVGHSFYALAAADLGELEAIERTLRIALAEATDEAWRAPVERLLADALADARASVLLSRARKRDIDRFIDLRQQLDDVLDEGIQLLVDRHVVASQEASAASLRRASVTAVALLLAMLVIGLVAIRYLLQLAITPLRDLTRSAAILASGDLAHRIDLAREDELGILARDINRMAARLQSNMAQLSESHELLEHRVEERTQELAHLASHDVLTGLANRAGLHRLLDDALKAARRRGEKLALLLLDLDGFKDINDSLGHDQGDHLLRETAHRLRVQVRDVDTAARLGGDEFCLLLTNIEDGCQAAAVAERCLEALAAPITLAGATVGAHGSIGIALYPDDAVEFNGLLKAADTAMYAAKRAGKYRYAFYDRRMTEEVERQSMMESALRAAVERGEFELHYQPQVELASGRVRGVEALVRWRRPDQNLAYPAEFIAVVERIGLIDALDEWVLATAVRQAVAWRREGLDDLVIAVNVSPRHFESPGFVDTVARALRETGLAPDRLEIETTENVYRNPALHAATSAGLRDIGVRIAIDHFGVGFASMAALKRMPIDTLKLGRPFVRDMLEVSRPSTLLQTIIGIIAGLNYAIVAEGVETLEQARTLSELGCPLAQGYFFSPPVPADQIPALAHANLFERASAPPAVLS